MEQTFLLDAIANPASPAAEELIKEADRIRAKTVGSAVHLRGLIEFSSYCRNNCLYCGLRRDNRQLTRYRMTAAEIIAAGEQGASLGYKTVVLQSGEDPAYTGEMIAEIVREIKKLDWWLP